MPCTDVVKCMNMKKGAWLTVTFLQQISHVIANDRCREQLEVAKCNLHNIRVPVTLLQADAQGTNGDV